MTPRDEATATADRIPLPPPASPVREETADNATSLTPTSGWLAGLVCAAFAFLLASFPARSADLWLRLAHGRQLASGDGSRGAWDLGWPFDLAAFGFFQTVGGTGLIAAKALLVAVLGGLLWRLGRLRAGTVAAAVVTLLALLAMSTRFQPQPGVVSVLLLALVLLLRERRPTSPLPLLPPWPLLLVFVAWANVEATFVIGLAFVALADLGRELDGGRPGAAIVGLVATCVLAGACLLNPRVLGAYAAFAEFSQAASVSGVVSPFQAAYLETLGATPAALAYYSLVGLGLVSFLAVLPRVHLERLLPWLAIAGLSAVQVRAIPFFAVATAPLAAWNMAEALANGAARRLEPSRGVLLARQVFAGLCGLLLLAAAWPGWLQAPPYEPRRWGIETPTALERGAAAVRDWRAAGQLRPEATVLHLTADSLAAFAWFCPDAAGRHDSDLLKAAFTAPAPEADRVLDAAGVTHFVLQAADRGQLFAALGPLLAAPQHWPLLHLDGGLAVFGRSSKAALPMAAPLDLDRRALSAEVTSAPPQVVADALPRRWWEAFWKTEPRPEERDEAMLYLLLAEADRRSAPLRHLIAWDASGTAGLVAGPGAASGLPSDRLTDVALRLRFLYPLVPADGAGPTTVPPLDRLVHGLQRRFAVHRDDVPPAVLHLAVRNARQALRANPNDAQTYLVLGEAYLRLLHSTRERAWAERMPELGQLRRAQASAALNRAITLRPDLAQAHLSLAGFYQEVAYLDLAHEHLQTYAALVTKAGPGDVKPEVFQAQLAQLKEDVARLGREVKAREDAYTVAASGKRILDRVGIAIEKGLAGQARKTLLDSDIAAFGDHGLALELGLLLQTGRVRNILDWVTPEHRPKLGTLSYHWLRVQAFAASGAYGEADAECADFRRALDEEAPRQVLAQLAGTVLLDRLAVMGPDPLRAARRQEFGSRSAAAARNLCRQADVAVIRGVVALEAGDTVGAERAFVQALALWGDERTAASGAGLDFGGRTAAEGARAWLLKNRPN